MRHLEENMQIQCVKWFEYAYHKLSPYLHHSPNGGRRNVIEAARFKAMGTRKGFPDLILLYPSKGYHALLIEMKTEKGRQSPSQREWQEKVESVGNKYVICRSLEQFIVEIEDYINKTK